MQQFQPVQIIHLCALSRLIYHGQLSVFCSVPCLTTIFSFIELKRFFTSSACSLTVCFTVYFKRLLTGARRLSNMFLFYTIQVSGQVTYWLEGCLGYLPGNVCMKAYTFKRRSPSGCGGACPLYYSKKI